MKRLYALYRRPRLAPARTRWAQVGGPMPREAATRFWQNTLIYGDGSGDEFRLRPIDNDYRTGRVPVDSIVVDESK